MFRKNLVESFSELNLSAPILKAVTELGYEKPSPIQAQTLPILLGEPTDFLGLAATGTGKTAAFSIPMLERLQPSVRAVQSVILCPTRELALQVAGQINLLGKYKGVRTVAIYGGSSYTDQIQGLRQGATVVVGTPGRICDHIDRGTLKLDQLTTLILDEADEMISMGFKDDLEKVLGAAPRESSQIWLFSATMSREVRKVADDYLRSPKQVQVNRTEMLPSTVEQFYYPTQESNKPEILCKLIEAAEDFYGLVFCQTKSLVADLTLYLMERGYKVDCLHGDKDQNSRERTMQAFRDRKVTMLICTDVAARGLDVKDITHVINYSLPRELDNYVHRIGRTARSGKKGIAMNLVTPSHRRLVFAIEQMTKTRMLEGVLPSRREIGAKKVSKVLPKFVEQEFHARVLDVMSDEWKTTISTMTPEEVASRFITMMMPDVFVDRERAPARTTDSRPERRSASGPAGPRATFRSDARSSERRPSIGGGERRPFPTGERRASPIGGERRPTSSPVSVVANVQSSTPPAPISAPPETPAPAAVLGGTRLPRRPAEPLTDLSERKSPFARPAPRSDTRQELTSTKTPSRTTGATRTTAPIRASTHAPKHPPSGEGPTMNRRARRAAKFQALCGDGAADTSALS